MLAMMLGAARRPSPTPAGELSLDAAQPVLAVEIEGVPLRLRVDLDQQDSIELNPKIARKLPLTWADGLQMDVGRERLRSHIAVARLRIADRILQVPVSQHGRDCCTGSDGAVGPDLLPFAIVRWRNLQAAPPRANLSVPLTASLTTGLSASSETSGVRLRFSLAQEQSVATAAAASALASTHGGQWDGVEGQVVVAFGISRPSRLMLFANPAILAGFRFDQLVVRFSDFAGETPLPTDPAPSEEVVVRHALAHQAAWPAVTIGADRLSRCAEIVYRAVPRSLVLHCAFD